jgi:hypothetical protein
LDISIPAPQSNFFEIAAMKRAFCMYLRLTGLRFSKAKLVALPLFACLMVGGVSQAAAGLPDGCPNSDGFRQLVALGSSYLGEMHGTAEAPRIVRCVVEADLATATKPIVVALEMPSPDTYDGQYRWKNFKDGKTSDSMWRLLSWLRAREGEGQLKIHYESPQSLRAAAESGQVGYEKVVAGELKALAAQNLLIAYGGAFHSRREGEAGLPNLVPAGALLGDLVKHVFLAPNLGGEAWFCKGSANACGPYQLDKMNVPSDTDSLVDGAAFGHDFLYLLGKVSAAKPQNP